MVSFNKTLSCMYLSALLVATVATGCGGDPENATPALAEDGVIMTQEQLNSHIVAHDSTPLDALSPEGRRQFLDSGTCQRG